MFHLSRRRQDNTFVTDFDEFRKCADTACVILGWRPRPARRSASPRFAAPDFMIEIGAVATVNS